MKSRMQIIMQKHIDFKDRWFKGGKNKRAQACHARQAERLTSMTFLFRCPVPQMPICIWRVAHSTSRSYHRHLKRPNSLWERLSIWLWVGWEGSWFLFGGGTLMGFNRVSCFCIWWMPGSERGLWVHSWFALFRDVNRNEYRGLLHSFW